MNELTLISHRLCPYVQRAAIALDEKGVAFERVAVDLAHKPRWFQEISPLGKVPLLRVRQGGREDGGETLLFESAVILEYLEDSQPHPLHPAEPLARARHRAWIEYGSATLAAIWRFYSAEDSDGLDREARALSAMFARVEIEAGRDLQFAGEAGRGPQFAGEAGGGPWFAGKDFSLVDAAFGPIFRYFDSFDRIADFGILSGKPKLAAWRRRLAERPSVRAAVDADYPERLTAFLAARNSALSALMAG